MTGRVLALRVVTHIALAAMGSGSLKRAGDEIRAELAHRYSPAAYYIEAKEDPARCAVILRAHGREAA